ncbi:NAD-dependent 15-hydroxyprostaglandin dehydrogenase [Purpureocillium lavendulum]|uniref:NAD-dependent 15-hydroxyprostaglandin dehydrogenase n=1 Tax=Purpureocillium lavendulum TaxID=1247861 RepID=A0AB34G018_9HYPO|nr:NAD-dependent 15-hydroxyprostaglandin dehydrogenase [Purpureocillium lavendulum]
MYNWSSPTMVELADLQGKAALITGGGSGINLAFAQLLLEHGCSVIIGDLALQPEAQALVDKYTTTTTPPPAPASSSSSSPPPRAIFHRTDVTSFPQLSSLFAAAVAAFPPPALAVVVAGAGIFEPPGSSFWSPPRTDTNPASPSRDDADAEPGAFASLSVNLIAPMRLAQLAIAHWARHGVVGASFVAVSSIAGHTASPTYPFYFASKHGLHGFVRSMGMLRDAVGIRFGAVAPGAVKTKIFTGDPSKADLASGTVNWIPASAVAAAMLRLVVDPALGDGTILEVLHSGTRVVPLFNADPPEALDQMLPALQGEVRALADRLASGQFSV